jgi:L-lactate dehydrogenase complex protein LldG
MSAKEAILGRIRLANLAAEANSVETQWDALPREYRRSGGRSLAAAVDLLEDRLRDYDAVVERCANSEVAATVARMLATRGKRRLVIAAGLPQEWLPASAEFVVDDGFTAEALDSFEGVLTGATVAIAETGTVVLQNVPGQGRRAISLVPDYHLCVVQVEVVVETVPEGMDRLAATAAIATTFVSGPSATADIEMTRIKGVHGPRFLDVLLVG